MTGSVATVADGTPAGDGGPAEDLEAHRRELTGFCYRMLGSLHDAEDAVQETMIRAWRGLADFDGRSSLRSWVFRIATNVCLTALATRSRRALPVDLSEPGRPVVESLAAPTSALEWVEPAPDDRIRASSDPADVVAVRDSVRLAFVAALQHLPPRQRAVLILRDVLRWHAAEVAELLDTTVAAVNSTLQRARATTAPLDSSTPVDPVDPGRRQLLDRYVDAFERYDMPALLVILHEDATQSMPPYALWLRGRDDVVAWMVGPGRECRGSRLLPAGEANGCPAFGQYRPGGPGGTFAPWALHVVEVSGGLVTGLNLFLDTSLFPRFGLPPYLD